MEVFLIMPTSPEDRAKLSHKLAKFHAEQALKWCRNCPGPLSKNWLLSMQ